MKKYSLLAFVLIAGLFTCNAQDKENPLNNGIGFGFQINQYQQDFGFGLSITSPYFVHDRIALRLRGNLMFNEIVQNSTTIWVPYSNLSLGIIGVGGMVGDRIRLYGEGGIIGLYPSDEFSYEQFVFGGYGLFGFEFFMSNSNNYFIEIGGIGTGAKEDKIANEPIYSNGLLISAGFRFFLK